MDKEYSRRQKISHSLVGNTRRLGTKDSVETRKKKSVALQGRVPWNKGKSLSAITKEKMSVTRKGISTPWMRRPPSKTTKEKLKKALKAAWCRPEIRKKYYDAIEETQWLKVRTDKGQLNLLNKWNTLGFNFEPNYPVRTKTNLFYVDGYDQNHRVVIEYDGKYHNKPGQMESDLVRQDKIIQTLNPRRFWRFNLETNTFRNVIGLSDGK